MHGGDQHREPWDSRVDTVIVFKTLDAGSTFLDEQIFRNLPHVSRWGSEVSNTIRDSQKLAEFFEHKQGEEIVGGSMEYGTFQTCGKPIRECPGFYGSIASYFTPEKQGRTLLIELVRHPVEKWINILRRDELANAGCDKNNMHLPECSGKKTKIDAKSLFDRVTWDDSLHLAINDAMAQSMSNKSNIFIAKEVYEYPELLRCQGIPQRINRYFGNDEDGCNHKSTYLLEHPLKRIHEIVDNVDELQEQFKGSKWEEIFTSHEERFFAN
jgi:hypothetical protein